MREAAWTVAQVAERANVSTRTVQRWVKHDGLPARRVGRRGSLRIEPAEFEAWWAAQATRPTAPPPATKRRTVPAPVEGYGPWPHPDAQRLRHIA
jgi:excisionase family DNA binding protein